MMIQAAALFLVVVTVGSAYGIRMGVSYGAFSREVSDFAESVRQFVPEMCPQGGTPGDNT